MTEKEYKQFKDIEVRLGLFDYKIKDIYIWERVRFQVIRKIDRAMGVGQAHTSLKVSLSYRARQLSLLISNIFSRNSFLAEKADLLFYGHERRVKLDDHKWWDIYCDPVSSNTNRSYIHMEDDYLMSHRTPPKTKNLYYLDAANYLGSIERFLGLGDVSLSKNDLRWIRYLRKGIRKSFQVMVNIKKIVERYLSRRKTNLKYYRYIINRIDPEAAIIVVSYGKETFIESCKKQGIPTIELQHGTIDSTHPGYDFPNGVKKRSFPDYLFVWGDHWKQKVNYPIEAKSIVSVGYPYLNLQKERLETDREKKGVVFISQGTIGHELSRLAVRLGSVASEDTPLIYKLHPGEYDRWEKEYPWLLESEVKIIDESGPGLHEVLSICEWQVGVNSTAMYEGIAFGAKTLLFTDTKADPLNDLVCLNAAELVNGLDSLIQKIKKDEEDLSRVDPSAFFAEDALDKTEKAISRIVSSK